MRTRERSLFVSDPGFYTIENSTNWTNPAFEDSSSKVVANPGSVQVLEEHSVITDDIGPKIHGVVHPTSHHWSAFQPPPLQQGSDTDGITDSQVFGAKRCHHTVERIKFENNLMLVHAAWGDFGNPIYERYIMRTLRFGNGLVLARARSGGNLEGLMASHSSEFSDPYLNHDWFALADSFNEKCDQYLPSSMNVGEPMVEHEIFAAALKTVINPSSAIRNLIRLGKSIKHHRKMKLGRLAHSLAKQSANTYLTTVFGILPAIRDVQDALKAHSTVSSRLRYLRRNAGKFVPIRAKRELSRMSESELTPPDPVPGAWENIMWQTTKHSSTAVISALGRVRADLSHGSDWAAYLQYFGINKVVGLAWELIPFSFVVDWFTNVQERLNSLTRLRTGGPFTEFRNICHSIKLHHQESLFLIPGKDNVYGYSCISPTSPLLIAKRDIVDYNRSLGIPDTSGVVDFSALGLFHAMTGAALIVQRVT